MRKKTERDRETGKIKILPTRLTVIGESLISETLAECCHGISNDRKRLQLCRNARHKHSPRSPNRLNSEES